MLSTIDPSNTKWRYFFRDENGVIQITDDQSQTPQHLNKVALLSTSTYFCEDDNYNNKDKTPKEMKDLVETLLGKCSANFCIALPIEKGHGAKYYDKKKIPQGCEAFHDVVMHQCAAFGGGYVTATTGAEQIASAIQNGFHICQMYGGFTIDQKIPLVREYFRQNPLSENCTKTIFLGFSNGSGAALGLRELTEYVCGLGAAKLGAAADQTSLLSEAARQTIELLAAREKSVTFTREMFGDQEDLDGLQARYQKAIEAGDKIRHITIWQRELLVNVNSPYRIELDSDEKLILSLEGFPQSEAGFNVHEVLYRALETGALKPEQILCIVIENLLANQEQMKLRRINGRIPDYEYLHNGEKNNILKILGRKVSELSEDEAKQLIVNYIANSNQASENEEQRIKEVARKFGIPVIFGGEKRAGHSTEFLVQPTNVVSLDVENGTVTEISEASVNEPVQSVKPALDVREIRPTILPEVSFGIPPSEEQLITATKDQEVAETFCEYQKNAQLLTQTPEKTAEINHKISQVKLLEPARKDTSAELCGAHSDIQIVGGTALNIVEQNSEQLAGKGLLCLLQKPEMRTCNSPAAYLELLIASGKLGKSTITPHVADVPLVIFSIAGNPAENLSESYLTSMRATIQKTLEDFGITTPIFFTEQQLTTQDFPPLFSADINLIKMLKPDLVPENPGSSRLQKEELQK